MLVEANKNNMVAANGDVLDTVARMEQTMLQMMVSARFDTFNTLFLFIRTVLKTKRRLSHPFRMEA